MYYCTIQNQQMESQEFRTKILSHYTDHVLAHEAYPKSVFKFCQTAGMEEKDFYSVFGSLDAVREYIWEAFFINTMSVLEKDKNFKKVGRKEKLLSFYFTFFELLLLNRSYVLFALHQEMNNMKDLVYLKGLRCCKSRNWAWINLYNKSYCGSRLSTAFGHYGRVQSH